MAGGRKSKTYEEFVEKFKPKKTTDDCITPPEIYEAIKDWACARYNISAENILRPFWPGGDYESEEYPENCVVIDNPPFSILSKICEFYLDRDIKFFLFALTLTCFGSKKIWNRLNHIVCDCDIEYENGATVHTSFVTNLDTDIIAQTAPDLTKLVNDTTKKLRQKKHRTLSKYDYPDHIVTAAMMSKYAARGIYFEIKRGDGVRVTALDAQKKQGKAIFGGGLLLSDTKAEEKAEAERAAEKAEAERAAERAEAERAKKAIKYELSERERAIVAQLGKDIHLEGK